MRISVPLNFWSAISPCLLPVPRSRTRDPKKALSSFFCPHFSAFSWVFGGAGIRQKDGGRKMGIGTEANEGNEGGFRNQDLLIPPLCFLWSFVANVPCFCFPIFAAFFHSNLFRISGFGFRFRPPGIFCRDSARVSSQWFCPRIQSVQESGTVQLGWEIPESL